VFLRPALTCWFSDCTADLSECVECVGEGGAGPPGFCCNSSAALCSLGVPGVGVPPLVEPAPPSTPGRPPPVIDLTDFGVAGPGE